MKAKLTIPVYVCLGAAGLSLLAVVCVIALMRWQHSLPSDQKARQHFEDHKAAFVRFASMLRQDRRARVIDRNGLEEGIEKRAQAVPEYRDLMSSIGAQAVYVRADGSIEFQIWGFGCAPCSDSFKGLRYFPIYGKPQDGPWAPRVVDSLDDESLPKDRDSVADSIYIVPLEPQWAIYRIETN
jgi:hypothetical protein